MLQTFFSCFPAQKTIDPSGHLQAVKLPTNHLLTQVLADDNLDAALDWLRDSSCEQDHSDVWDYSREWDNHKAALQNRVRNGEFQFQTVREVEIAGDGHPELREIRSAEDRVLIRAIAQVLQPLFAAHIAPECVHLAGRGGTQQAVTDTHAQLKAQPKAWVMKSDVKGYYAQIDHLILHAQFCTLLPNEIELQHLLWQFMRRTVARGGHYRDVERGIPLGASLSPLLGALYLSPLDALFSGDDTHFYRRYMDDWVIFCRSRWELRKVVKQVYAVLHALRVTVAEDKTYIGKASKGFDFLGKRILPIGVLPSDAALSRMQRNTVRLYEQGASHRRIWKYWMRWLGWAGLVPCAALAYTPPDTGPDVAGTATIILRCSGSSATCLTNPSVNGVNAFIQSDSNLASSDRPFNFYLPDNDPSGATWPVRIYSWAKSSTDPTAVSVPPVVSCASATGGTPSQDTYSTRVALADGTSCSLTVSLQANGDAYADVTYSGTLSRTGNIYSLTSGTVTGGPFGAAPTPTPVGANSANAVMLFLTGIGILGFATFIARRKTAKS